MIAEFGQDLRFALRQWRKHLGFTLVAVLTLALGIGANTAIFSVIEGIVLAPLQYSDPDRLVMVWESNPRFPRVWASYPNLQDWQRTARSFQQIAAFRQQEADLSLPGVPSHVKISQISSGFFSTLGTGLVLGREFTRQENQPGGQPVAVISNEFWTERFGASPDVLGKLVTLDDVSYSIVGVTRPGFYVNGPADVYTPLGQLDPLILNNRASHDGIYAFARLRPGVSLGQSQSEMRSIQQRLDQQYPNDNRDLGIYVEPLKRAIIGDVGRTLFLLFGAVGLVLLIACANVASLMLARSAARSREFAVRSALGASRPRLFRQLLTESIILSSFGALAGTVLAFFAVSVLLAKVPVVLPRSTEVGVSAPVLLYTLTISVVVGILFGVAPALKARSVDTQSWLKQGGRASTATHRRMQGSLLIVQVGLTLLLLVGAGLLLRTILQLWGVNPGFDTHEIVTLKVGVSHSLTKTPNETRAAYQRLIEQIRQVPGVQAAEFSTSIPLSGDGGYLPFWLDSHRPESLQGAPRMGWFLTGPDYLRTVKMQLLQGRFISKEDGINSPCVAVIDSNFAHAFFPDGKPIGHSITAGFAAFGPCAIVGVVNHVKYEGLDNNGPTNEYQAYYSLYQDPDQWVPVNYPDASVLIRTPLDPATLIPAIKAVADQVSDEPIYNIKTMQEVVSNSMSQQRFPMILLGAFAGLALFLAAVGIYGTISYSVVQRVKEIGIRMALGADQGTVLRQFLGEELRLVLGGIGLGIVAAVGLARSLSSLSHLLYGVGLDDPVTFATASTVLIVTAALAGYIPARRAAKVDPMVAIRYE